MPQFPYKSFCWSLGTTSFRTESFNKTIEEQLKLLREFWNVPDNASLSWSGNADLQTKYYDFMKKNNFVDGNANNKPKDAREKTSGLVDLGIIDDARRITPAGLSLLKICDYGDFRGDNVFQIDKDSYIYLKQMLKVSNAISTDYVRPFIVLLYVLNQVGELSSDQFKYLLPLCINCEITEEIVSKLSNGVIDINETILKILMEKDNYKNALDYFLANSVTESVLMDIGMNRKSRTYDKPYYELYKSLYNVYVLGNKNKAYDVYLATKKVNIGIWWRDYLFNTIASSRIKNHPLSCLKANAFDGACDDNSFKKVFFEVMHLFKAKATLSDYYDLNRRYVKTTDCVLFIDGKVKLDIAPHAIFKNVIDTLYEDAYTNSDNLTEDVELEEINSSFAVDEPTIVKQISEELGITATTIQEVKDKIEDERYERLNHLIDTKFTDGNLLYLFDCFKNRTDDEIQKMVTDNADVPTIFEYILGLTWYKISERKGKILDYLKLSLDSDLLPKEHAQGGEADIVYEYEASSDYPAHSMLLEATLADSTNQRRMEMEPVSRHLGQHLLKNGNMNSYCVFATNFLHINVISDFRSRKSTPYYDSQDYSKYVDGMKIIPLETAELKTIITKKLTYKQLYVVFDEAYKSSIAPHEWYKNKIVDML